MNFVEAVKLIQESDKKVYGEGLIKTYPTTSLRSALGSKIKQLKIKNLYPRTTYTGIPIGLGIVVGDNSDLKEIRRILDVYGYHVGSYRGNIIEAEPKFPFIVPVRDLPKVAYHVTTKQKINKILSIGLTPRDSQGIFKYSGSRIYLLVTESLKDISALKDLIEVNKKTNNEKPVEMGVLRVRLTEPFYYIDPNLEKGLISDKSFGIFTVENIDPEFIAVTNL